jgi:hypothetical protein
VSNKPTGWVYFSGAAKGGDEPAKDSIDKEDNPSDIIELLRSRKGKSELEYYLNQKKKKRERAASREVLTRITHRPIHNTPTRYQRDPKRHQQRPPGTPQAVDGTYSCSREHWQ